MNRTLLVLGTLFLTVGSRADTLRIATWNISDYRGDAAKAADIQNVVYGAFEGRSMSPDVILAQEIQSSSAATAFLAALNGQTGGPTDWAASYRPLTGTSTSNDAVAFYRTGKVALASTPTLVLGKTNLTPRDIIRWDFSLGTATGTETLAMYDVHLKSSSGDNARRLEATQAIRADAGNLASGTNFLVGGDFNVQASTQSAYQALVGGTGAGRFNDPIDSPGTWNGNSDFRFIHTQDPSGPGGMDDRHDQILLGDSLVDGKGLDYVGTFGTAYSTATWNDPNHSYRAWGNDGTSFNTSLTTTGNAMVGASIAQSLKNLAGTAGGHLPVFLDLSYTAPVPEPGTFVALGLGALAFMRRRRHA